MVRDAIDEMKFDCYLWIVYSSGLARITVNSVYELKTMILALSTTSNLNRDNKYARVQRIVCNDKSKCFQNLVDKLGKILWLARQKPWHFKGKKTIVIQLLFLLFFLAFPIAFGWTTWKPTTSIFLKRQIEFAYMHILKVTT